MIVWAMLVPLAASVALGLGAATVRRSLPPRLAATVLTGLALVTALATGLVLCVAAGLAFTQLSSVARPGRWSAAVIAGWQRIPSAVGLVAGLLAAGLLGAAIVHVVRVARRMQATARACRGLGAGVAGLVVVDDERSGAFAVPGRRGRTVVTRGLLRRLDGPERRALLAHETAHLRHRHVLHVQLTELAAVADPLLRPVARAVRLAVESWADDEAARTVGDPAIVARTLAKAAIACAASVPPAGALAVVDGSDLTVRVDALLRSKRHRPAVAVAFAGVVVAAAACALLVAAGAHGAFEHAQDAPPGVASTR
jgi:Zn-dependent protease with chaperone function